jgi:hypothetical protein
MQLLQYKGSNGEGRVGVRRADDSVVDIQRACTDNVAKWRSLRQTYTDVLGLLNRLRGISGTKNRFLIGSAT